MSYIKIGKEQLVSLEKSTTKELLRTNSLGSYSCTSLNFCNTRKYHGLLVVPQPQIDNDRHVLLSSIDETIIQNNAEFNLGLHRFPNNYYPKGHKYVENFSADPIPTHIYRIGGVILKKEIIFSSFEDRIIIKYTLLEAKSDTFLRLKPFLAFRNFHTLSKSNLFVNTKYVDIDNGVSFCMYKRYNSLNFQLSEKCKYIHVPNWYYSFEYVKEIDRGYEGHEDLFVPGYFETKISKDKPIYISIGTIPVSQNEIEDLFNKEVNNRTPRNSFENTLINSLKQFLTVRNDEYLIIAGYPWYHSRPRDTFVSLVEMSLSLNNIEIFHRVLETQIKNMDGAHFSFIEGNSKSTDYAADTSLFFIRCLQQFNENFPNESLSLWNKYSTVIKNILYSFKNGQSISTKMNGLFLLSVSLNNTPITWMNSCVDGEPVVLRDGMTVEANALWYNAIMYSLSLAYIANDQEFIEDFVSISKQIPENFKRTFWNKVKGYLADYVNDYVSSWSVRPNMIIAASLPYSPLSEKICSLIIEKVKKKLLTSRGLRTLSPDDVKYKSHYYGNENERAKSFHQGSVWPWMLASYAEASFRIYSNSVFYEIYELYKGFDESISEHAIGSISEVFDGDPPHRGAGAISMAWSVAEILRLKRLIDKFNNSSEL